MGLFSRKPRDGVRGTAQVVSSTAHGGRAAYQNCRLHLVVQAEGMQPYSVEHSQMCPASKWPRPGSVLPVVVSRKNPSNLRIDFDAMADANEVARQMAEQQAAMLRNGGTSVGAPVTIVGGTVADIPPEKLARLEQMLGTDVDGDGRIGGATAGGTTRGAPGDDRLVQLERLAHLRAAGALTDAEFETEKRRVLSS